MENNNIINSNNSKNNINNKNSSNNETRKLSNLNGSCNLSIDQCDMTSLEILNKCHLDLFPKKKTTCDDVDCMRVVEQLPILNGEYIQFIGPSGKNNEEILLVTNFRLFLLMHDSKSFINVPLMLIESIEVKEILYIYIYLKNVKTLRLTFCSNEKTSIWCQRLNSILIRPYKLEELFAFTFYSWLTNEKSDENKCLFSKNDSTVNLMCKEFKRLKFDPKLWRISEANKKFELCPTYPETVIVPKCTSDDQIKKIASFRSSKRFPAVVWRSKTNGAVLARSSQPNVGLLGWRMNEDEALIKAIADMSNCKKFDSTNLAYSNNQNENTNETNGHLNNQNQLADSIKSNSGSSTQANSPAASQIQPESSSSVLLIIDARFRTVALANRVKGGGYEYSEYYTNCEIQFMNLENIHVIRSSFQQLRLLCQTINDNKLFYSQLENTKWLHHLSGIMKAACTVINAIDRQAKPVLIHCSDGWDRTPQILALAKLLLDPYYRTISGFRSLVEVEWLMFGHKFSQRNGHSANNNDINERCPVFLQWLDCVYQIQRQFPWAFEFNETFLLKLCYHSYSCLFGTFLCDSAVERVNEHIEERTFSVWSYLNDKNKEMINYLYDDSFDEVLYPMCELVNMQLWQKLFCESEIAFLIQVANKHEMQNFNESINESLVTGSIMIGSQTNMNGSSQQIDDDLEMESSMVSDLKNLTIDSSPPADENHSATQTKKSILEKRLVLNKLYSAQNQNGLLHKTRSYEDMSKSFIKQNARQETNNIDAKDIHHDDSHNPNTSEGLNGDPIHMKSCSESNLLFDALQTISSTSPKLNNPIFSEKTPTSQLNSFQNGSISTTPESIAIVNGCNESELTNSSEKISCKDSIDFNKENLPIELNTEKELIKSETEMTKQPSTTNSSAATSCTSSVLMQKSTDTLVDESGFINGKKIFNEKMITSPLNGTIKTNIEDAYEEDDLFDLNNRHSTSNSRLSCFRHGSNGSLILLAQKSSFSSTAEASTTPLSSSIPSPASFTIHNNFRKHSANNNNGLSTVSTSTSGLSDYVASAKFRMINDTIKYFNKSFNDENNFYNSDENKIFKSNDLIAGNDLDQKFKTSENLNGKRQASNSIPIVKKYVEDKKRNKKKSIQDCIDIDGLTKILDPTCRKVMERDDQYKKEIASLKDQVNKCKSFLNSLTNNTLWQEGASSFSKNDLLEKSQIEENQSNSYSFSNDSVCSSSWDEIDESDYRLATWVPDYCISHCQNCNSKFSYRLRKHHCRNCGQVFCYKCADQFYPLPNHNLTAPVRVCYNCKQNIEKQSPSNQLSAFNQVHRQDLNEQTVQQRQTDFFTNPVNIKSESFSSIKLIAAGAQQQDFLASRFSYSPSSVNSYSNNLFTSNQQQQQHSFSKPIQSLTASASSTLNIGSRCNQLDSNKFKKNSTKSQKVSV